MELSRRRVLQTSIAFSAPLLAGCSTSGDSTPSPSQTPRYQSLRKTPLYRSPDIGLRVPDRVPTVETPTNADLIVLHAKPDVDIEQVVTWFTDDRALALLGDSAQSTWSDWTQRDAFRDTFTTEGRSEANPTPHLIVAASAETTVTTYRYSWDDLPSNEELLDALDDAMTDVRS